MGAELELLDAEGFSCERIPKSDNLTAPSPPSRMLCGLMSLCTIRLDHRAASPSSDSARMYSVEASDSGPTRSIRSCRDPPDMYSSTRQISMFASK